ncbi:CRISPR-associated protein [archaeon BMS3Bbin15]|nr:CRISPR-associated protein [archaeon BMS3Bbin15]
MIIKIDSLDTLFFRDGKPFTMGEDTWSNGLFPPSPSVLYGAIRSAYFSNHIDELKKATKNDDPTKNLKIVGVCVYLSDKDKTYLPLPNNCVQKKDNKETVVSVLPMNGLKDVKSSCPAKYALKSVENVANVGGGLIKIDSLKEYLECSKDSFSSILKMADRVLPEPKIGIGISKETGTSEEGKLYRVDMMRLENKKGKSLSLVIDFEGLDLPERGMMKLGGEGKAVSYQKSEPVNFSVDKSKLDGDRFKLYLSTPAIFKNGWLPQWIDENTLEGEYKGLKLQLLTASIGKPILIGGFDMKARKPKPMYKAVPAGSMYYFEIIKGDLESALEVFDQKAISDFYPVQGFGIAYVGGIGKNA